MPNLPGRVEPRQAAAGGSVKKQLAWPMRYDGRYDGSLADEYRAHRRHHGWLRDFMVTVWVLGWIAVGLVLFFAVGSVQ